MRSRFGDRAVEEMLRQTEEDADKEILELKTRYERALRAEREGNVQLRGESGVLKKKFSTAIKDGEEHRANIHRWVEALRADTSCGSLMFLSCL